MKNQQASKAIINTNWSTSLFYNYVNVLPTKFSQIRGAFFYYVINEAFGNKCFIILPESAPVRYFSGEFLKTKDEAKKSACFNAII